MKNENKWDAAVVDRALAALKFASLGEEVGFSWYGCDLCGTELGGDRHHVTHANDGPFSRVYCCTDCALYMANGDTPEGYEEA